MKRRSKEPNFIVFITDQHRADHLGCYGNNIVQTPNIDNLAKAGTKFEKFFVSCPICMPNRATFMTGRMPSLHGVRQNGISLSFEEVTFTQLMRNAGYRTALIGKSHLQGMSATAVEVGLPLHDPKKKQPSFDLSEARRRRWSDGEYQQELKPTWNKDPFFEPKTPFYGFDHLSLAIGHSDRVWGHYSRWLAERHPDPESIRGPNNALPATRDIKAPQAWRTAIPEELYPTTFIAEESISFIKDQAKNHPNSPFMLQCSFGDPHHPFTPPGKYFDMYDPADVPLPDAYNHPEDKWPPHLAAILAERDAGLSNKSGQRAFGATEEEVREAIALNYGSITMIDDAIGQVICTLSDLGLDDNTVIIFTTDHGDFMGDHQLLLKGALHYQGLIRVPCILSDPNDSSAPGICSGLSGTIDLAGTILEIAGIQSFNGIQSKSLVDIAHGLEARTGLIIEENQRRGYMGLKDNFKARTLLSGDWRLTLYSDTDWGEIYNLKEDPNEFHNLWNDLKYASIRSMLLEQMLREIMDGSEMSPVATTHGP
ncbi:MAG: sulfatase [Rhodospirillaceae bacterium]|nr:sulfatase [Rhodospirillaceae bacterium]